MFGLNVYSAVTLFQRVKPEMIINTQSLVKVAGSKPTLSRALRVLENHGFVRGRVKGWVAFIDALWQPMYIIESILPSLKAFMRAEPVRLSKTALRFREDFLSTLDWKAWELTGYQTPKTLYIYADSAEEVTSRLWSTNQRKTSDNMSEEPIFVLPKIGEFHNPVERTYLDCVARGGRSWLDAVAIELLYPNKLRVRASFPVELVAKVLEDLNLEDREGKRNKVRVKSVQVAGDEGFEVKH